MTDKMEWQGQVGTSWARQWQRTDRSFSPLTERLVERILVSDHAGKIADIGCGAGELSIKIADARPDGHVLGLDISADLIAAASERSKGRSNLNFGVADASVWQDPSFIPDLYISRHGVMFFDAPVAAFTNLAASAAANAQMVFSCFRAPAENAWATNIAALVPSAPSGDPHAPGPFAFADPERVKGILSAAGWTDVGFEPVDFDYVAGRGEDPVADALDFFGHIGPAARAIRMLEGEARTAFLGRLRDLAEANLHDGAVRFAAAAWIVTAHKN
ncbi:MAG: methyltransferase domain-containing protein [Sphingomonadales bacterium]|nr:methyltransferase domain-containing protein [Sphingomonadales bacterium]